MQKLINWYHNNKRDLPWRHTNDPYCIWLSEIILQQTRVEQGLSYYCRFVDRYPTVYDLANAPVDDILLLWQGLGYYSRARNLHTAAKYVVNDLKGVFPKDYKGLLMLKGVGDYTASAIASIAYNLPEAVVDGNVYRVLARYFADNTPIDTTEGKKRFKILAEQILDTTNAGVHNQALMELGACVCKPVAPECNNCPLVIKCEAFKQAKIIGYPVKLTKVKQRKRYLYYIIVCSNDDVYIERREGKDIWEGLYQFLPIESEHVLSDEDLLQKAETKIRGLGDRMKVSISKEYKHLLSHQHINTKFVKVDVEKRLKLGVGEFVGKAKLEDYAMPRLITRYLEDVKWQ